MNRQRGFTIIEVMLFLAVSGLLLVAFLASVNGSIRNSRFSDATRSVQAFLQQQYTEVTSGVSKRGVNAICDGTTTEFPGTSGTCVVTGKLIAFTDDTTAKVYTVVSDSNGDSLCTTSQPSGTPSRHVASYCPRLLDDSGESTLETETFTVPWGVTITKQVYNGAADGQVFNRLAILRSPTSERMYLYAYNDLRTPGPGMHLDSGDNGSSSLSLIQEANLNPEALFCLQFPELNGPRSYVKLSGGQGADVIVTGTNLSDLSGALTC